MIFFRGGRGFLSSEGDMDGSTYESRRKRRPPEAFWTGSSEDVREGEAGGHGERDCEREERMRARLLATRGLLLHLPYSCRFNDSATEQENDWNIYVRMYVPWLHLP